MTAGFSSGQSVVLCALPLGYGPAAKALAIAEHLASLGIRPVCLATGIASELLARSRAVDAVIEAPASDERARSAVRSASVVVSLMEPGYAALALEHSRPLHVVDSVFWMRDHIPQPFLQADRYWVQDFVGVRERAAELSPPPTVVGPIVRPAEPGSRSRARGLVVSLGGYESPYSPTSDDSGYADFVVRGLLESELYAAFRGETLVMAGAGCVEGLKRRFGGRGLELTSLPHAAATARMAAAALVLTSPGLTTTMECFQVGTPVAFLPPQNYSQWLALKKFRGIGLAPCSYHWEDDLAASGIRERMPMESRVPLIREAIGQLSRQPAAMRTFRESLDTALTVDRENLAAEQKRWFDARGRNGTRVIAEQVAAAAGGAGESSGRA